MRKVLIAALLLLAACHAEPPQTRGPFRHRFSLLRTVFPDTKTAGGGSGTSYPDLTDSAGVSVTSTVPIILPDTAGSGAPSVKGATAATGLYLNATVPGLVSGVNNWITVNGSTAAGGAQVPLTGGYGISSSGTIAAAGSDVWWTRKGAGNWRAGAADLNGAPVAQTISVQNAITGSNLSGAATFSLIASLGTGIGTPGVFQVQGAAMGSTGTTAQVAVTRLALNDTKQLTSAAPTTALSVPLPTLQMMGGTIDYYIEATDGTNQCTSKNTVQYAGENSAGVFKVTVTKEFGDELHRRCNFDGGMGCHQRRPGTYPSHADAELRSANPVPNRLRSPPHGTVGTDAVIGDDDI